MNEHDQALWEAVVTAERELARRRADFNQQADSRAEVLAEALRGSGWQQATAMKFLATGFTDHPRVRT